MIGLVNVWSLVDGALLQTVIGGGGLQSLAWVGAAGLAACFARSKVWRQVCLAVSRVSRQLRNAGF